MIRRTALFLTLALHASACHSDLREGPACDPFHTPRQPGPPVTREQERSAHAPFSAGDCAACHEPRASLAGESDGDARRPGPAFSPIHDHCLSCHDAQGRGLPGNHPPEQSFCITCHDPHSSRQRSLLLDEDVSRPCLTYSPPFRETGRSARRRSAP
jgi:predicted CXXCH cytochrome family protein